MNNGGDAAEQIVRLSLEGFEVAVRLTGSAAKNIAILLASVLKQEISQSNKTRGKARLTNMIKSGKELKVFSFQQKDLPKFTEQAKRYGVLYCVLRDKNTKSDTAMVDIKAFELSKKFNLDINKRFKALSKGYQSIFKLIIALSLNVPYVIFDEPVLGLDANHRELFYSLLLKEFENNERTLIIATHLIEEVSNIIEEVVLIDKGKILLQETVEELLEKGYSISGVAQEVDHYCEGKNVIGYDELGGLKIAYVLGEKTALPQGSNLQVTAMNLQKLFVKMTEKGGGENE